MKKSEEKFRNEFIDMLQKEGIFVSRIEPSRGMKPGIPDILTIIKSKTCLIELKICLMNGNSIECSDIRPAQIKWHRDFSEHGGVCFFAALSDNNNIVLFKFDNIKDVIEFDVIDFKIGELEKWIETKFEI